MTTRSRTDAALAGRLDATRLAATLGRDLREGRRARQIDQRELGRRVGLSQSRISAIERGDGAAVPLGTWVALGIAVGRPIAAGMSRAIEQAPADAGHLDIQEGLVRLAAAHGREVQVELATRPADPRHSVDVVVRDGEYRYLLLEGWNRFGDLGLAIRSTDRKIAELQALAPDGDVRVCWVVRATAANRELVRRYPAILRARFPGSSHAWARALNEGTDPPREPGIVWWADDRPVAIRWPPVPGGRPG